MNHLIWSVSSNPDTCTFPRRKGSSPVTSRVKSAASVMEGH